MAIYRVGSRPSGKGPPTEFTGNVRRDPLFSPEAPARATLGLNTFEAGGRTHWHTHPYGQTLYITQGLGWVQIEGGPVEEVRPGDVVWFPALTRHWHGASPTTAMSHISVTEAKDGVAVTWLDPVTDAQYKK